MEGGKGKYAQALGMKISYPHHEKLEKEKKKKKINKRNKTKPWKTNNPPTCSQNNNKNQTKTPKKQKTATKPTQITNIKAVTVEGSTKNKGLSELPCQWTLPTPTMYVSTFKLTQVAPGEV